MTGVSAHYGDRTRLLPVPNDIRKDHIAVFFGCDGATVDTLNRVRNNHFSYVYIDNAYLGGKGRAYRVTVNGLMASDPFSAPGEQSKGERFKRFEIWVKPWKKSGDHILIALQSALYHDLLIRKKRRDWMNEIISEIKKHTDRPIRVREKPHQHLIDRGVKFMPLEQDLYNCHAVVTWNSTTALKALCEGVPAFCMDPRNSFKTLCPSDLSEIENPYKGDGRLAMFEWLADNQWTLNEIQDGHCWAILREQF